jgi:hypothetical protein
MLDCKKETFCDIFFGHSSSGLTQCYSTQYVTLKYRHHDTQLPMQLPLAPTLYKTRRPELGENPGLSRRVLLRRQRRSHRDQSGLCSIPIRVQVGEL